MHNHAVYKYLLDIKEKRGGGFLLLIDPDKSDSNNYLALAESALDAGVDALLVGTSFMLNTNFSDVVRQIKEKSLFFPVRLPRLPLMRMLFYFPHLFPGGMPPI